MQSLSLHRFLIGLKLPSRQATLKMLAKNGEDISYFKIREAQALLVRSRKTC